MVLGTREACHAVAAIEIVGVEAGERKSISASASPGNIRTAEATLQIFRKRSLENGIVERDDILRKRMTVLKSERERAKATLNRDRSQNGAGISIDAEKIGLFARPMIGKLETGDVNDRKAYIRAVISAIEIRDKIIRIIGCNDTLLATIAGKKIANENVRGFVRKWRARKDSNL